MCRTNSKDVRDDVCVCVCSGFGGPECNFEYNECESNPCSNGGTCLDRVGEFQCICPVGYAGSRCETQVKLGKSYCLFFLLLSLFYIDDVVVERLLDPIGTIVGSSLF